MILSPATYKPDAEWVEQQAEAFVEQARGQNLPVTRLMRDNDSSFYTAFYESLRRKHVKIVKPQFRSPNMNAFAERWIQFIQQERPHQSMGNRLLSGEVPEVSVAGEITCHERLGGLLKSSSRKAA